MNIILDLFDQEYVEKFFTENILPKYPDFDGIKKIEIEPIKRLVWQTTYHVVIKFDTVLSAADGQEERLPIFCSAHSSEPRKNVYDALEFLWSHNFARGNLTIPHPLFYSERFNGTFYRGVSGHNLYYYIQNKDYAEIESILPRAAAWLAKLHRLPVDGAKNFNPENSRIKTAFPGTDFILKDVREKYPALAPAYERIYERLIAAEEAFLGSTGQRWLIHGDAHPENIIKVSAEKLAVIDFTDLSLADFTRDLGSFSQQLEFMCNKKIKDQTYADKVKKLFLDSYLREAGIEMTEELRRRIDTYYNWTTIRTAGFFLTKFDPEPQRAQPLVEAVSESLGLRA